ncbi:hypothetical protein bcCo53_001678 (plasmid) [Borrelia coriaceae]|uniref:Uncharacterized protein n=1 Tax=Borrelia coriaceae ATCC 43381 TaxID=1408429 RepID=W5SY71_9SPIR|nr:hypothetical protein [Borrelia coriaceae]AHH11817.1 Hypothetical protein BCO_0121902 [Borrelia coriaceae ATCC 43381]UPA17474.1 hypothetical protein bcCo53_001678 [Borrelia coriaceae]
MSNGIKKHINIIGSIATALFVCVSWIGTYAFKGFLVEFKKEMMGELRVEAEERLKSEFESLKSFLKESLKKDIEKLDSHIKEMIGELEALLFKEQFKIKRAFKQELKKCFDALRSVEDVNYDK